MNTYPKEFKNQVYIVAYGIEGLTDHVDSEVYDAHEAFEIDKTKMKMLVPLNMNGKQLMNVNYDLKFGDIFKVIKCYSNYSSIFGNSSLKFKNDYRLFSSSVPIVLHSINLYKYRDFGKRPYINIMKKRTNISVIKNIVPPVYFPSTTNTNEYCFDIPFMCIFTSGIRSITLSDVGKTNFNVNLIVSYM